jgi:hypothetical protein
MKIIRHGVVLGLVIALTAGVTAASAQETTTDATVATRDARPGIDELKARARQLVGWQSAVVDRLQASVENSRFITEGHAGRLQGDLANLEATLERLAGEIDDASTPEAVWSVIRDVHALHIPEVIAPKTRQVIASDSLVAVGGKLQRFAERLEELLTRAEENGHDVDAGWVLLEEMEGLIESGVSLADPVAESVIGLDGDDWPDPAQGLLAEGRRDLRAAGLDLRQAFAAGREIIRLLRSLATA